MDKRDFITFWQEVHTIIDEAMEKKGSNSFGLL